MPVGWETHSAPLMGERPQEIINKQVLENSDLLIGVFWTRIGTPTGEYVSGSVEEIKKHIDSGKPAMLYFSSAPVRPDSVDQEQYEQLKAFKEECKKVGLIESYESISEFREKFSRQLALTIQNDDYIKGQMSAYEIGQEPPVNGDEAVVSTSSNTIEIPPLTEEAKTLLIEASVDKDGRLMKLRSMAGLDVITNHKHFTERGNPRSEAAWKGAVELLESHGLIEDLGWKSELFAVTADGYQIADILKQNHKSVDSQ